jgi:hypothetical protein
MPFRLPVRTARRAAPIAAFAVLVCTGGCGGGSAPTEGQAVRDMNSIIEKNGARTGNDLHLTVEGCVQDADPHKFICMVRTRDGIAGSTRLTYNPDYSTWIAVPQ